MDSAAPNTLPAVAVARETALCRAQPSPGTSQQGHGGQGPVCVRCDEVPLISNCIDTMGI